MGYNENFGNYMATSLTTVPTTARLRIGLAHSSEEGPDERDDVDFDAYIVRLTDEDGDVISEGDDVATVASSYGTSRLVFGNYTGSLTYSGAPEFSNVRINDGGDIRASIQAGGPTPVSRTDVTPNTTWTPTTPVLVTGGVTSGFSNVWPQENLHWKLVLPVQTLLRHRLTQLVVS